VSNANRIGRGIFIDRERHASLITASHDGFMTGSTRPGRRPTGGGLAPVVWSRAMETLLEAHQLTRRYGPHRALEKMDLRLGRGEVLGLLGPNGAGKSTCLALLAGNLRPDAGQVRVLGRELWAAPRAAKAHIGYLPEQPPLYPDLWVDEQLEYAGRLHGLRGADLAAALARVKGRCGLDGVGRRLIRRLSKGYRQRLGIAQAILHRPDLVLLDEPTVGLDPLQIREVRDLVRELGREGAVLLSSHLLAEVQELCSRVLILHQGRVVHRSEAGEAREATYLRLRLSRSPAPGALDALPGVAGVEALAPGEFRVRLGPEGDAPRLAAGVVRAGWGLEALGPENDALEQALLRAVAGESAP
jgi:ABC-2 type transport system ATP-binding protein